LLLFRHKARWSSVGEVLVYVFVVSLLGLADLWMTLLLLATPMHAWEVRSIAAFMGLVFNFLGRKYLVFPEPGAGPWRA
jgi:putative flippase GtrA